MAEPGSPAWDDRPDPNIAVVRMIVPITIWEQPGYGDTSITIRLPEGYVCEVCGKSLSEVPESARACSYYSFAQGCKPGHPRPYHFDPRAKKYVIHFL